MGIARRFRQFGPEAHIKAHEFLRRDALSNLAMIGHLDAPENTLAWYLSCDANDNISAIAFLSSLGWIHVYGKPDACYNIGLKLQNDVSEIKNIVGPQKAVAETLRGLGNPSAKYDTPEILYSVRRQTEDTGLVKLRIADMSDLKKIDEMQQGFYFELITQNMINATGIKNIEVLNDIANGNVYVAEHNGDIIFKAHAVLIPNAGAYIHSGYTVPKFRDTGLTKIAAASISSAIVETAKTVGWFVDKRNIRAINCYNSMPTAKVHNIFQVVSLT